MPPTYHIPLPNRGNADLRSTAFQPAFGAPVLTSGEVALQWTAAEGDLECLVLRRSGGTIWRPLGPWGPPGDYAFIDADVETGVEYDYRVRVRDRIGLIADGPVLHVTAI